MEICFKINGRVHCFWIPVIELPVFKFRTGPGPVNIPALLHDASILASVMHAAESANDERVRASIRKAAASGFESLKAAAGEDVSFRAASSQ